jgi:hypothetical protein
MPDAHHATRRQVRLAGVRTLRPRVMPARPSAATTRPQATTSRPVARRIAQTTEPDRSAVADRSREIVSDIDVPASVEQ